MRLLHGGRRWLWDNKNDSKLDVAKRRFFQQHHFLKEKRLCQDLKDKKRSLEPCSWSGAPFFRQPAEEKVCSSDLKKEYGNIRKNSDA